MDESGDKQSAKQVEPWPLIPYESAFMRNWYFGGVQDMRLPFVVSAREAAVSGVVLVVCVLLLMLGAPLNVIGMLVPLALFLPRLVRDRAFDNRSLQGFVTALATWAVRPKLILPGGERKRELESETLL